MPLFRAVGHGRLNSAPHGPESQLFKIWLRPLESCWETSRASRTSRAVHERSTVLPHPSVHLPAEWSLGQSPLAIILRLEWT
eukprot:164441-Amphidinium_carterae.1